ncbi:MAG: hypothetical protein JWO80_3817 [Bryobacterales bacterium]|nr:hypothetical protein [Bryobacterales bacterium]
MKRLSLLFLLCFPAFGQLSYGILGGVPFTNLTTGSSSSGLVDKSSNYTIGPTLQLGLPLGFRVEADALYRPAGLRFNNLFSQSSTQWRFPILVQYRLSAPILKPFVEAGYSYDHLDLRVNVAQTPSFSATSHHGFVLGAGVDFKIPFVRISPEIRYTRDVGAGSDNVLELNQAEFLVGVRF